MINRLIRNICRLPIRTVYGICRLFNPVFKLQRQADKTVLHRLSSERVQQLSDVPGTSSQRQCRLLYHLAYHASQEGCVVEIGAFKGKSTAWIAEALANRGWPMRFISIDPHQCNTWDIFNHTLDAFNLKDKVEVKRDFSGQVGKDWTQLISLLWVDGSHEYEDVKSDILYFTPHTLPGAYLVFDDANKSTFPGVVKAIKETLAKNPDFEHIGQLKSFAIYRRRA